MTFNVSTSGSWEDKDRHDIEAFLSTCDGALTYQNTGFNGKYGGTQYAGIAFTHESERLAFILAFKGRFYVAPTDREYRWGVVDTSDVDF